ncbi:MAG: lytic transglycosylase domain-containing protein [Bacillota bacterium]|nr:lytic transglycosylase domain-containing protein [Bacillota bacterium]
MRYEDHILASGREFDIDPFLIAAVIRVESNYRPAVVSPKGAVGLMQLLPDTARQVAGLLRMTGYSYEALSDPRVNIRLGSAYMRLLLTEFGDDKIMALAAYNGGLGHARDWWRQGILKPGGGVAQIPFVETRNFVERVLKMTAIYRALYADKLGQSNSPPGG